MVVALLLTLGFTAAGISTSSLNLATRGVHAQTARNVAEAALAQAAAELLYAPDFASDVTVQFPGATGTLTFNKSQPLHSTNNLASDSSAPGSGGTVVPGQSVHLVGLGVAGGVEHRVEVVIFLSRYPYAVAASGPILSDGGLQVAAEGQQPTAVASNAKIELSGPNTQVTGDVQATETISLAPTVKVEGEVREHADPVKLPSIKLTDYDTDAKPGVVRMTAETISDPLTLTGYSRSTAATLRILRGLHLDNAVLYVQGNLEVDGGLTGTGAVIVKGTTTVHGGTTRESGQTALLSEGDVVLRGLPEAYQAFQGLIYTEGNLDSRYLTLRGVFVANNKSGGSTVRLDDTRVLHRPLDGVSFPVTSTTPGKSTPAPTPGGGDQLTAQLSGPPRFAQLEVDPDAQLEWDGKDWSQPPGTAPLRGMRWHITTAAGEFVKYLPAADVQELLPENHGDNPQQVLDIYDAAVAQVKVLLGRVPAPAGVTPTPDETGPAPGPTTETSQWKLDLSQFLNEQDRLRILIWRDI